MDSERDHYAVLQVSRGESLTGIHKAYRRLAKQFHPDHAGMQGTGAFRSIQEAYEVLSDPDRRRRYDDTLSHSHMSYRVVPEPLVQEHARPHAEAFSASAAHPRFEAIFRNEIRQFARSAEAVLSPILLSPRLTTEEIDLIRFYLQELIDRYGL